MGAIQTLTRRQAANYYYTAELPRYQVEATYSAPTGQLHQPANSSELTTLLGGGVLNSKTLAAGDTIELAAGTTYTGPFTIPKLAGSSWVYVRSSALASLPSPGRRVAAADATNMPTILAPADQNVGIGAAAGAHHFRFVGIQFKSSAAAMSFVIAQLAPSLSGTADIPHHITFDRCYFVGDATFGGREGVSFNVDWGAIVESRFEGFFNDGYDSQGVFIYNCNGPILIRNNYISGASESMMVGGSDPSLNGMVPSDITIVGNHFSKPLSWIGVHPVKNNLELKLGRRVLVEKNVFENCWQSGQSGFSFLCTVRNQSNTAPWSDVSDVVFRLNKIKNSTSGISILTVDEIGSGGGPSVVSRNLVFAQNLIEIVDVIGGGDARAMLISISSADHYGYVLAKNTLVSHTAAYGTGFYMTPGGRKMMSPMVKDNIFAMVNYGVLGDGVGVANTALNAYTVTPDVTYNCFTDASAGTYPATNLQLANVAAVLFTDWTNRDYTLQSGSPCKGAASDGGDMGCNVALVEVYASQAVAGTAS